MPAGGVHIATVGTERTWTVLSLLGWAGTYLRERGFSESRLHAELLLGKVLGLTRLQLYLQYDRPLGAEELGAFKTLFRRRLAHEPLQYILGETEFMGMVFAVDPRVLIPRPETELLVESAAELLRRPDMPAAPEVLDIGTGSGNIAVALGKFVPGAHILGIDVSEGALEVAARNVAAHGAGNVEVRKGDIREEIFGPGRFDMILSNPPYIPLVEMGGLQPEVRDFEPSVATTDGADGLSLISRVCDVASISLRGRGWLLLEIGFGQGPAVLSLASGRGFPGGDIVSDYGGIPRVFRVRRSRSNTSEPA